MATILGLLFTALPSASASAVSAGELLQHCNEVLRAKDRAPDVQWFNVGHCGGYIDGSIAGSRAQRVALSPNVEALKRNAPYCIPEKVSNEQLVRVVVKWLSDNPARLHEDADFHVFFAFSKAFPCRDAK